MSATPGTMQEQPNTHYATMRLMVTLALMAIGGWLSGKIFDLTGSYHLAFINGIAWNALNLVIGLFLLRKAFSLDRTIRGAAAGPHSAGL